MSRLATTLCGVPLRNPIVAAAGTAGYGPEIAEVVPASTFGAVTTKSITPESRVGNDPWRVTDLPAGMLNAIGLANVGLERFMSAVLPELALLDTVIIGSIAGHRLDDYVEVASAFAGSEANPLRLVELNVSCPNTSTGRQFGDDPDLLAELVTEVAAVLRGKPLLVKLSAGAPDPVGLAEIAVDSGASGITVTNTMPAMAIDPETRRSRIGRASGGLSGSAIHPIAVRFVHEMHRRLDDSIPIVGLGGVMSWSDAAEFTLAGARAVGVGTGLFVDPRIVARLVRGLDRWVGRQGVGSIADLVGRFEP
ncbi:MAG: dihydroorotate dehydrogenase [Planctomycetota bacterium]|nr:dihydroorotate dehydrogenase [Planctomycetota bacterium]